MSTPVYTKNFERGDESSGAYWRIHYAMQDDAICSMLNERVLHSLAMAFHDGIDDDGKAKFSVSAILPFTHSIIEASALSILGDRAKDHIANVVYRSLIVNEEE